MTKNLSKPDSPSALGDILSPTNSAAAAGMAFGSVLSLLGPSIPGLTVITGVAGAIAGEKIARLVASRSEVQSKDKLGAEPEQEAAKRELERTHS